MIFRDDDISCLSSLPYFSKVQDLFDKFKVRHTIAVIARDIEMHPSLIAYIKDHDIDVQLHCWDHVDLTQLERFELRKDLENGIATIKRVFGKRPMILYPPWNRSDATVEGVAKLVGLRVNAEKISLDAFIRAGGDVAEEVINFHYWDEDERDKIGVALELYCKNLQEKTIN